VVLVLLIGGAVYAIAGRTADTGPSRPAAIVATALAGGSTSVPRPTSGDATPGTVDATPIPQPTPLPAVSLPSNAQPLEPGQYGVTREGGQVQTSFQLQSLGCPAPDQLDIRTTGGSFIMQLPAFEGYDCTVARAGIEQSVPSGVTIQGAGVGIEYRVTEVGSPSQVVLYWQTGGSTTQVVREMYRVE
jgi:hypothetical protein